MNKVFKPENGLTLIEVLVSIWLFSLLIIATAMTILNCLFLGSYARHRIQAMYTAQEMIEQQRRQTFSTIPFQTTTPVTLDPSGNNNSSGSFLGTAIITVANLDAYRNQMKVEIDWQERVLAGKITAKEYYSTNIVNDPVPN